MATLKEIIAYSKANPESDYAKNAYKILTTGGFDEQAKKEGIDLSWAGRPSTAPNVGSPEMNRNVVKNAATDIATNVKTSVQDASQKLDENVGRFTTSTDPIEKVAIAGKTAADLVTGATKTLFSPITSVISAGLKGTKVEPIISSILSKSQTAQEALSELQTAKQNYPDLADALDTAATLLPLALGGAKAPEIGGMIKSDTMAAKEVVGNAVSKASDAVSSKVEGVVNKIKPTPKTPAQIEAGSWEKSMAEVRQIVNPAEKYNPTEAQTLYETGQTKATGKSVFRRDVATPKPNAQQETLAELVQQGKISAKSTPGENIKVLGQEAKALDQGIDELVNRPDLNKPFTTATINKRLQSLEQTAKDNLTFVSDSVEERAYKDVMRVAQEEIKKQSFNNSGLRTAIKGFNARMEKILGNDIYSGSAESVGNARLQAAKDIRATLNDFLADNLESAPVGGKNPANVIVNGKQAGGQFAEKARTQGGDLYRAQLRKEAQLLNARNEIAYKSRSLLGKSKAKIFLKKHPVVKNVAKYGATGAAGALVGGEVIKAL